MFGHIIVDGPDAVGKTTLAQYINDKYSFKVVHSGADCKNDYDYYHELITSNNHTFYDLPHYRMLRYLPHQVAVYYMQASFPFHSLRQSALR